jgi:hypothetical protein
LHGSFSTVILPAITSVGPLFRDVTVDEVEDEEDGDPPPPPEVEDSVEVDVERTVPLPPDPRPVSRDRRGCVSGPIVPSDRSFASAPVSSRAFTIFSSARFRPPVRSNRSRYARTSSPHVDGKGRGDHRSCVGARPRIIIIVVVFVVLVLAAAPHVVSPLRASQQNGLSLSLLLALLRSTARLRYPLGGGVVFVTGDVSLANRSAIATSTRDPRDPIRPPIANLRSAHLLAGTPVARSALLRLGSCCVERGGCRRPLVDLPGAAMDAGEDIIDRSEDSVPLSDSSASDKDDGADG